MTPGVPHSVLAVVAAVLLGTVVLGLIRIWRGPDLADRILTAQLFGTTGVALLLVLGQIQEAPALRDVALLLALMAVLTMVAFVARVWRAEDHSAAPRPPNEHSDAGRGK